MSESIRISDVFNVPVAATSGDEHRNSSYFKGLPLLYSGSYGINCRGIIGCVCFVELPDSGTSPKLDALKAANYAAIAINAYDANQALITKQAEQIKMLRDSLLSQTELWCKVVNTGDLGKWNPEDDEEVIASRAALEATKPVEE